MSIEPSAFFFQSFAPFAVNPVFAIPASGARRSHPRDRHDRRRSAFSPRGVAFALCPPVAYLPRRTRRTRRTALSFGPWRERLSPEILRNRLLQFFASFVPF